RTHGVGIDSNLGRQGPTGTHRIRGPNRRCSAKRNTVAAVGIVGTGTIDPQRRGIAGIVGVGAVEVGVVRELVGHAAAVKIVEQSIAAAEHGFARPKQVVSNSDAWTKVVLRRLDERAIVTGGFVSLSEKPG